MKLFFALFLPPLAVLMCGKPIQFLLCCVLTLCGWIPGVVHALMVVGNQNADNRTNRIVREMRRPRRQREDVWL